MRGIDVERVEAVSHILKPSPFFLYYTNEKNDIVMLGSNFSKVDLLACITRIMYEFDLSPLDVALGYLAEMRTQKQIKKKMGESEKNNMKGNA
jgi:hypothetical protein